MSTKTKIETAVFLIIVAIGISVFMAVDARQTAYYKAHPLPPPTPTAAPTPSPQPTDALSTAALRENRDFWDRAADLCWRDFSDTKRHIYGWDMKATGFKRDPNNQHRLILHCVQFQSGTPEASDLGDAAMLWYPDKD